MHDRGRPYDRDEIGAESRTAHPIRVKDEIEQHADGAAARKEACNSAAADKGDFPELSLNLGVEKRQLQAR
eukprot:2814541-Pleurochrysis_carterae.AAC.1